MTVPLIVLTAIVPMGGSTVWLLLRRHQQTPNLLADSQAFAAQAAGLYRYRVMSRLLAQQDADFVCRPGAFGEENRDWFLSRRRRIMRTYLRELRQDFGRMLSMCRYLAPYIEDPNFGTVLLQQSVSFYCAYALLILRLSSNRTSQVRLDTDQLVAALRGLRKGVGRALQSTDGLSYQASSNGG